MNVCMTHYAFYPTTGGVESHLLDLCQELVRQGHDVTLFASGDSKTSAELIRCCDVGLGLNPVVVYGTEAQKIRMRLGGSANMLEEFPNKPKGMDSILESRAMSLSVGMRSSRGRRNNPRPAVITFADQIPAQMGIDPSRARPAPRVKNR